MRKAKDNVEKHYTVVGVLEDFNKTLAVLEHYVPRIFKGSLNVYWGRHDISKMRLKSTKVFREGYQNLNVLFSYIS